MRIPAGFIVRIGEKELEEVEPLLVIVIVVGLEPCSDVFVHVIVTVRAVPPEAIVKLVGLHTAKPAEEAMLETLRVPVPVLPTVKVLVVVPLPKYTEELAEDVVSDTTPCCI